MTITLPSFVESSLCDTGTVRLLRRVNAEKIGRMADGGELQWAFDVSSPGPRVLRDLRFLFGEVACPQMFARLTLQEVIGRILPPTRKFFWGSEATQILLISPPQLMRLAPELGAVIHNRAYQIPRENFARWLAARHLGGQSR